MWRGLREPVNGLTHFYAAIASLLGIGYLLYLGREQPWRWAALLVYGISLVLMFASSAAYHMVNAGPRLIQMLRKLDHSAIFVLIAGTYTPICLYFFDGFWRTGFLAIIWAMTLAGIIAKLFIIHAPRWLSAGIYLLMGWASLVAIQQILLAIPAAGLVWLALGGLAFTVGAGVYISGWPVIAPGLFGAHELWHIFVILGALCHYILVAAFVANGSA